MVMAVLCASPSSKELFELLGLLKQHVRQFKAWSPAH
jgi:hypothetical protein